LKHEGKPVTIQGWGVGYGLAVARENGENPFSSDLEKWSCKPVTVEGWGVRYRLLQVVTGHYRFTG
jgi:hypothetical protein